MKVKYRIKEKPLPHHEVIDYEYCCDKIKSHNSNADFYILYLNKIKTECEFCNAKIELIEVK